MAPEWSFWMLPAKCRRHGIKNPGARIPSSDIIKSRILLTINATMTDIKK